MSRKPGTLRLFASSLPSETLSTHMLVGIDLACYKHFACEVTLAPCQQDSGGLNLLGDAHMEGFVKHKDRYIPICCTTK